MNRSQRIAMLLVWNIDTTTDPDAPVGDPSGPEVMVGASFISSDASRLASIVNPPSSATQISGAETRITKLFEGVPCTT